MAREIGKTGEVGCHMERHCQELSCMFGNVFDNSSDNMPGEDNGDAISDPELFNISTGQTGLTGKSVISFPDSYKKKIEMSSE